MGLDPSFAVHQRPASALFNELNRGQFLVSRNFGVDQSLNQFSNTGLCHPTRLVPQALLQFAVLDGETITVEFDAGQFQLKIADLRAGFVVTLDQDLHVKPDLLAALW